MTCPAGIGIVLADLGACSFGVCAEAWHDHAVDLGYPTLKETDVRSYVLASLLAASFS
jgi:hypothetical protein